jgi:hypothetical protein
MLDKIRSLFARKAPEDAPASDLLFAIAASENFTASFLDLPPDALVKYLDSQAQQLNDTDAAKLFVHQSGEKTYVPLFTTYERANAFGQALFLEHKQRDPRIGLLCLPVVQMHRAAIYARAVTSEKQAILDPGTDSAQQIDEAELKAGARKTSSTEIKKHLIILKVKSAPD